MQHVKQLRIQDNDFVKKDFHRLPFGGSIDWDEVCLGFAEKGYDGDLTFEAFDFSGCRTIYFRDLHSSLQNRPEGYLLIKYHIVPLSKLSLL